MENHECKLSTRCYTELLKSPGLIKSELLYHQTIEGDWTDYNVLIEFLQFKKKIIIILLLNEGCRVQNPLQQSYNNSPLYFAIRLQDVDILKVILNDTSLSGINHTNGNLLNDIYNVNHNNYNNNNNIEIIDLILRAYLKERINPKDSHGLTPFHIACRFTPDLVEKFLSIGDYVNDCLSLSSKYYWFSGWSPLHFAVSGNHVKAVELLLENGANFEVRNKEGHTPLYYACLYSYVSMIYLLLTKAKFFSSNICRIEDKGLSIITSKCLLKLLPRPNWSPIHLAAAELNIKNVELLLKNQKYINEIDEFGLTPLHVVCFFSHSEEYLHHKDLEKITHNLNLQTKIVKLLLEQNACVNSIDKFGKTALHYLIQGYNGISLSRYQWLPNSQRNADEIQKQKKLAALSKMHMELIFLLTERGADITISDFSGKTVLHCLADRNYALDDNSKIEVCKMFLSKGIDIDTVTKFHQTPLCLSVENVSLKLAEYLITRNANVNYNCDKYEFISPIFALIESYASCSQMHSLLRLMLSKGADPNVMKKDGFTILHYTMDKQGDDHYYSGDLITLPLIEYGAKIDAKDKSGQTPLHTAILNFYYPGLIILLENGADINVEDNNGDTPLSLLVNKISHYDERPYIDAEILELIMNHVNKLTCLGLYVSEKNNKIIMETFLKHFNHMDYLDIEQRGFLNEYVEDLDNDFYDDYLDSSLPFYRPIKRKWDEYANECKKEIEKLKKIKVDKYNSLYDMLFKSPEKMASHVNNSTLIHMINSNVIDENFKLYGSWIKSKYEKGLGRKKLIDSAHAIFQISTELPDYCIEVIFQYLSNEDLNSLIKCVK